MKKKLSIIVLVAGLSSGNLLFSQSKLSIDMVSGSPNEFEVSTIRSITFPNGSMKVTTTSGSANSFSLSSINSFKVVSTITSIKPSIGNTSTTTQIYPNPTKGELTISFDLEQPENTFVEILRMDGTAILNKQVEGKSGNNSLSLSDTDQLSTGSYLVRIKTSTSIETIQLIKY